MTKLNWHSEDSRPDGNINHMHAEDRLDTPFWTCHISYDICRGATQENDDQLYIVVRFPNGKVVEEPVLNFEKGIALCENFRRNFFLDIDRLIRHSIGTL